MPKRDERPQADGDNNVRKRIKSTMESPHGTNELPSIVHGDPRDTVADKLATQILAEQQNPLGATSEVPTDSSTELESSQSTEEKGPEKTAEKKEDGDKQHKKDDKGKATAPKAKHAVLRKDNELKPVKVTVQTIVPKPTKALIDQGQVAPYDEQVLKRIHTLSTFVNKEANVYSLGNILPNATWGVYQPFGDHSRELCNPATNEPIIVWTVGHIASTWFMRGREPDRQASVNVAPLSAQLASQTARLLAELASPPLDVNEDTSNFVRATKWQSSKQSEAPVLFESVYDAREVFAVKSEMPPYSALDLKKNDLVLLESKITKYRIQGGEKGKTNIQRVQMEMVAVSLLYASDDEDANNDYVPRDITGLRI